MPMEMWTYRSTIVPLKGMDLTGYKVEALDGSIGKVDEATYATEGSYVVVDTGLDLRLEGHASRRDHRTHPP